MNRRVLGVMALGTVVLAFFGSSAVVGAENTPSGRVVVMYFHRTQRCPTCLKLGGYAEEAVKQGFEKEIKSGVVSFHLIDFQDPRNEKLANGYKIEGPTLIVARIEGTKVVQYKNLVDIWTKFRDKKNYFEYVQANVKQYLN